ncbi:MAG TPA: ROK family protein [Candidatus Wolfebacteria bacterium]|nr:ROK family protein [Candidatus Wolfebacteria bacterium]
MITLGLDIGATKIRYVVFDAKKQKLLLNKKLKYHRKTRGEFLKTLNKINQDKELKELNFRKIGIGIAGIVENGKLVYSPNFPKIKGISLSKEIKSFDFTPAKGEARQGRQSAPITIENDANCFAYAEAILGAGKKYNNIVGLTLGSGLGGGIIINKKIYRGKGSAGEVGHTIIKILNPKSKILNPAEAEDLCSEKFFHKLGIKNLLDLELKAKKGDKKAKKIYEDFGINLGIVIANIVNILDPDVVVLGGSLSNAYNIFIRETKKTAKKFIVNPKSKNIPILKSHLGKSAGAIGAALL